MGAAAWVRWFGWGAMSKEESMEVAAEQSKERDGWDWCGGGWFNGRFWKKRIKTEGPRNPNSFMMSPKRSDKRLKTWQVKTLPNHCWDGSVIPVRTCCQAAVKNVGESFLNLTLLFGDSFSTVSQAFSQFTWLKRLGNLGKLENHIEMVFDVPVVYRARSGCCSIHQFDHVVNVRT